MSITSIRSLRQDYQLYNNPPNNTTLQPSQPTYKTKQGVKKVPLVVTISNKVDLISGFNRPLSSNVPDFPDNLIFI